MILADMPAPLDRVTASTLVPSDSAPKEPRVAVAASAPAMNDVVQSAADAMPRSIARSSASARSLAAARATSMPFASRSPGSCFRQDRQSAIRSGSPPQSESLAKAPSSLPNRASILVSFAVAATYGGWPVSIAQRIAPRPKTSLRSVISSCSPTACSGGANAGVPSSP